MKRTLIILMVFIPLCCLAQIQPSVRFGVATYVGNAHDNSQNGFGIPNGFSLHVAGTRPISGNWSAGLELGAIGRDRSAKYEAYRSMVEEGDTFTFYRAFLAIPLTAKVGYTFRLGEGRTIEPTLGLGYKVYYWGRNNPAFPDDDGYWGGKMHIECGVTITLEERWLLAANTFPIEGLWFLNIQVGVKF